MRRRIGHTVAGLAALAAVAATAQGQAASTRLFESAPVHPLELTPDGRHLLAVNTDDHRLIVFAVARDGALSPLAQIPVGLEPVTVRARDDHEAWVVNHLSDSIMRVNLRTLSVMGTLRTGDEPTDVVFTGSEAWVCVSQEDRLAVYDLNQLSMPPVYVGLPGSDPRSLAATPDRPGVVVAFLEAGDRTSLVPPATVAAFGAPAVVPSMSSNLPAPPTTGLIVQQVDGVWRGPLGGNWSEAVPYSMPDIDLLLVDTASRAVSRTWSDVGTNLFNVAVDSHGVLWVTNQEAHNRIRFEPNLRGVFVDSRVTRVDAQVQPLPLNAADNPANPGRAHSLPMDLLPAEDEVFLAAMGSRSVVVLDRAGAVREALDVGAGPCGLAFHEPSRSLYILERFDHAVRRINRSTREASVTPLGFSPVPPGLRDGRRALYETRASSLRGDLSCASCHLFAGTDGLAWDLGDPQGALFEVDTGDPNGGPMHPMKGPMVTQSLKGLAGAEPFHWRGDRPKLADFKPAFVSLLGLDAEPSREHFASMTAFLLALDPPPNPLRGLANELRRAANGADPIEGRRMFNGRSPSLGLACTDCHLDPNGGANLLVAGPGIQSEQDFAVPSLRSLNEKTRFTPNAPSTVRGFGFGHDGRFGSLPEFFAHRQFPLDRESDVRNLEAYLLAFGVDPHAGIGAQAVAADGVSEDARLQQLLAEANAGRLGLFATETSGERLRGWAYRPGTGWVGDTADIPPVSAPWPSAAVTVTAVRPGEEVRLGIDHDADGHLDGDERAAGSDPHDPASTPDTVLPQTPPPLLGFAAPNPALVQATVRLSLPTGVRGTLRVFDSQGRSVRSWPDLPADARVVWNLESTLARRVPSGLYFLHLTSAAGAWTQRVTILPGG